MKPGSVNLFGATLSSIRENKKTGNLTYAFNITAQIKIVLVTRAVYTPPKWQFASTQTHLH